VPDIVAADSQDYPIWLVATQRAIDTTEERCYRIASPACIHNLTLEAPVGEIESLADSLHIALTVVALGESIPGK
jgi:hypothetical protein